MGSDEERLEEMLKAVMETEKAKETEMTVEDLPEIPMDDIMMDVDDLPDIPFDDLEEMPFDNKEHMEEMSAADPLEEVSVAEPAVNPENSAQEETAAKEPVAPSGKSGELPKEEMEVDPLKFLSMSEDEIDKILENEASLGNRFSGKEKGTGGAEDFSEREKAGNVPESGEQDSSLSDIEELLQMSDNHVQVEPEGTGSPLFSGLDMEEEAQEISGDQAEGKEKKPEKEKRKKKEKKEKKKEKKKEDKGEKVGLGKKLAALFFGSDDDEEEEETLAGAKGKGKRGEAAQKEGAEPAEKKKKEKKKKEPPKKKEPDPKKAAKAKQQQEKNAEKAKKKAEKAAQAEKERRAAKKLPKKKVIVWVLFCASIGVGILLMNSIGIETLQLTEARTAFEEKDFETAYRLLNGRDLAQEDQLLFRQSSAVLHLKHALEAHTNHLKLKKNVLALEDLLKGVRKYEELSQTGEGELITPEVTAEYQSILGILEEQYGLSAEGAREINAIESDYDYSLQLESIVNGEVYQSQAEIESEQEEAAEAFPELEDMLPGEEEFLNDSSN